MRIRFHARTDRGRKRPANEDNFLVYHIDEDKCTTSLDEPQTGARTRTASLAARGSGICFAVADGMGGHNAGEVASAVAVCTAREILGHNRGTNIPLAHVARETNVEVRRIAATSPAYHRMGTTLTAARITCDDAGRAPSLEVVQIGDSRAYLISRGGIRLLTEDQTYVQHLVNQQLLTPEGARKHPRRHLILQALGLKSDVESVTTHALLKVGDVLVLASDGLTEYLSAEEIERLTRAACGDLAGVSAALIAEANRRGGADNITVIIAEISGITTAAAAAAVHSALGTRAYDALARHAAYAAALREAENKAARDG